jgi:hypothetical protein
MDLAKMVLFKSAIFLETTKYHKVKLGSNNEFDTAAQKSSIK